MPMPTDTLPDRPLAFVRSDVSGEFSRTDDGRGVLTGLKIFRAGTFKDSLGEQRTWTAEHLAQMVSNFQSLRENGKFADVPVRTDHGRSIKDVVGYLTSVEADDSFLYGTIEFTEPEAADKWERGTYRSRSLEVGAYEDNDESVFWPVVRGLAFVDQGAVEGLHANEGDRPASAIIDSGETPVTDEEFEQACAYAQWVVDAEYAQWVVDAEYAQDIEDVVWVINASYAQGIEDGSREAAASFEAGDKAPMAFALFGEETADVNAVQRHIEALEGSLAEHANTARTSFVDGLVADHKVAAPQRDKLVELALGLNDEQYAAFQASYEAAPAAPLFAKFDGVTNPDGEQSAKSDEIEVLEEQVTMHRRGGMTEDQITELPSFKRLQALKAEQ